VPSGRKKSFDIRYGNQGIGDPPMGAKKPTGSAIISASRGKKRRTIAVKREGSREHNRECGNTVDRRNKYVLSESNLEYGPHASSRTHAKD